MTYNVLSGTLSIYTTTAHYLACCVTWRVLPIAHSLSNVKWRLIMYLVVLCFSKQDIPETNLQIFAKFTADTLYILQMFNFWCRSHSRWLRTNGPKLAALSGPTSNGKERGEEGRPPKTFLDPPL